MKFSHRLIERKLMVGYCSLQSNIKSELRSPASSNIKDGAVASEFHHHDHDLLSQSSMVSLLQMMLMIIIMISNVVPAAVAVVDVVILSYDQKSFN
ncbi:hypothetical protein Q3G72_004491 [Acer saccharum]|nr:hypothetical protein Q3G72_004491 [Acer saccharum]